MQTQTETRNARPNKNPPLSADPNVAMQEMMRLIDSLRGIYVIETDALASADTKTFLGIQQQKLDAARLYQEGIGQMLERKSEMKTADPGLRQRLSEMQKDFAELSRRNIESIQRMQRCTERLGNTIMSAARDTAQKQRTFNYGHTGTITASERKSVSMGISETA